MNTTAKANRLYFLIKKYPNIAKQKQNDVSVTSESTQAIKRGQKCLKGSSYPSTQRARCKHNPPGKRNSRVASQKYCNSSLSPAFFLNTIDMVLSSGAAHPRQEQGKKGATLKGMCWETFQAQKEQVPLAQGMLRLQGSLGAACLHHLIFPSSLLENK